MERWVSAILVLVFVSRLLVLLLFFVVGVILLEVDDDDVGEDKSRPKVLRLLSSMGWKTSRARRPP